MRCVGGVNVALTRVAQKEGGVMPRAIVGIVVDKLFTDENLRIRFALDPLETIGALCLQGFELTRDEIDLFCRTDARLWFTVDQVRSKWH